MKLIRHKDPLSEGDRMSLCAAALFSCPCAGNCQAFAGKWDPQEAGWPPRDGRWSPSAPHSRLRGGLGRLQHSQCLCGAAGNQHCSREHSHIRQKAFTRQSLGCILGSEFNLPAERGTQECTRLFLHKYFVRGDIYRWQKDLIYYHLLSAVSIKMLAGLTLETLCPKEVWMQTEHRH